MVSMTVGISDEHPCRRHPGDEKWARSLHDTEWLQNFHEDSPHIYECLRPCGNCTHLVASALIDVNNLSITIHQPLMHYNIANLEQFHIEIRPDNG